MYVNGEGCSWRGGDQNFMKTVAAAIEFGTSKIVTLLAESGGFTRCEIIGSGTVPYAGYMDGEWNDPEGLLQAIEESVHAAEVEAKRRIHEVFVGVPGEFTHVCSAIGEVELSSPDGRVTDEDIYNAMDAAAEELKLADMGGNVLHRTPAWFSTGDGKRTMRPVGSRGSKLRVLASFVLADPVFIEDVRGCLAELGITVNLFLAPTLGTAHLLIPFDDRDRTPVVMLDVGYLNSEFSVVEGDAITYHAVLPIGGGQITAALAEALEVGMSEAETIKRSYIYTPDAFDAQSDPEVRFEDGSVVTFPRDFVQNVIESVTDELIEMIQGTLEHAGDKVPAKAVIYLTGGGLVNMRGSKEYFSYKLGRAVKIPAVRASRLNNPRFASSLGLMDQVFAVVEERNYIENEKNGRMNGIKNIFRRNTNE